MLPEITRLGLDLFCLGDQREAIVHPSGDAS
jgi:hypothetical protein